VATTVSGVIIDFVDRQGGLLLARSCLVCPYSTDSELRGRAGGHHCTTAPTPTNIQRMRSAPIIAEQYAGSVNGFLPAVLLSQPSAIGVDRVLITAGRIEDLLVIVFVEQHTVNSVDVDFRDPAAPEILE